MKTTVNRIRLPENNLWQWADENRNARIRREMYPESLSRRMARGILARFQSLLAGR